MKYFGLFIFLVLLAGCGSSESEPVEVSYKTAYIMFNARHVSEPMQMEIVHNDSSDFNKTIRYSKEDSYSLSWHEEDNITLKYSQDEALHVSFPENPKMEGKKLICAIGNADATTPPMMQLAPESKDIHKGDAYIRVINAINDGNEKLVVINNSSARSEYTSFTNISDAFHIEHGSTNSLVAVDYKLGNTFAFDQIDGHSINFDADHAYFIIIYESVDDADIPEIAIIDMTP